jgi:hypothetical protein
MSAMVVGSAAHFSFSCRQLNSYLYPFYLLSIAMSGLGSWLWGTSQLDDAVGMFVTWMRS